MKTSRFTEQRIIAVLIEAEAGIRVAELRRTHGISEATFYIWRSKYGGMHSSEACRLRQFEENQRLKPPVTDQAPDILVLHDVFARN